MENDADESDFLELLVANARVHEWVEQLKALAGAGRSKDAPPGAAQRRKRVLLQLQKQVESRACYAEEAQRAGVVPVLTGILGSTEDEETMELVSAIISACSGPAASGEKMSNYTYADVTVHIREGALGDGLGVKVWTVAHLVSRELAEHPAIVRGHHVLEIGAGCGICGILAAKLGARMVDLTDVEGPVLRNLRSCMVLNAPPPRAPSTPASPLSQHAPAPPAAAAAAAAEGQQAQLGQQAGLPADAETFGADADSVDELDLGAVMLEGGGDKGLQGGGHAGVGGGGTGGCNTQRHGVGGASNGNSSSSSSSSSSSWEAGNMRVRMLDWLESLQFMDAREQQAAAGRGQGAEKRQQQQQQQQQRQQEGGSSGLDGPVMGAEQFYANDLLRTADNGPQSGDLPPRVGMQQRYARIIGSDIMYEPPHAVLVAAVVAHRLERGGAALLGCAVRQARTLAALQAECGRRGLRCRKLQVSPATKHAGILGRESDYEGGFLLLAVDHEGWPCAGWHREDWEA